MRIIAGEWGGRRLHTPDGSGTRPMLDRVRESLFAVLGDLVEDARVLDLYAGSGSLGLEALSRGARHARFVERSADALEALTRNVEELDARARVRVVRGNALAPPSWDDARGPRNPRRAKGARTPEADTAAAGEARAHDAPVARAESTFEIVFFDPPYALLDQPAERARLFATVDELADRYLAPHGVLVFHLPEKAANALRLPSGRRGELRTYGTSTLCLLWKRDEAQRVAP